MPRSAISFNVPSKIWTGFRTQTDALFLSRAPFLDHMIASELPHLREDLDGLKLSLRAKRHIAGQMKRQGVISVNIEVRPQTAAALREAAQAHNLVRDAFIARLLVFLRSSDALLKHLDVPRTARNPQGGWVLEEMPSSPLKAMEAVRDDPLFYVRNHILEAWEVGVYRVPLPRNLDWAACYLDDEEIPGTTAYRRQKKLGEELLAMFEDDAKPKSAKGKHK
jgi:hypothetical protein